MEKAKCREFMKNFFERLYQKMNDGPEILLKLPGIPEEMWADGVDLKEEWKKWKMIPSTVTEEQLDKLEEEIGTPFPICLRSFLSAYHHYFGEGIGRNTIETPFFSIRNAWNPLLVKAGYLPFTWDKDGYYIRCIDLQNMPDEEKCGIYQIDHEILFDFDVDTMQKEEIKNEMKFVSDNLFSYLEELL